MQNVWTATNVLWIQCFHPATKTNNQSNTPKITCTLKLKREEKKNHLVSNLNGEWIPCFDLVALYTGFYFLI